jgi:hypothetical protein
MENIFSPTEFFEFVNSGSGSGSVSFSTGINSEVFILFNPFDTQSLIIVENIISQLRDVFF